MSCLYIFVQGYRTYVANCPLHVTSYMLRVIIYDLCDKQKVLYFQFLFCRLINACLHFRILSLLYLCSRYLELWILKDTALVFIILASLQIVQGFCLVYMLMRSQRIRCSVIWRKFLKLEPGDLRTELLSFYFLRMATVSKDGTWKIWNIDGQ